MYTYFIWHRWLTSSLISAAFLFGSLHKLYPYHHHFISPILKLQMQRAFLSVCDMQHCSYFTTSFLEWVVLIQCSIFHSASHPVWAQSPASGFPGTPEDLSKLFMHSHPSALTSLWHRRRTCARTTSRMVTNLVCLLSEPELAAKETWLSSPLPLASQVNLYWDFHGQV